MRKQSWTKRDPIKNYFPLPNEIYDLGLSRGAISVYSFLLRREDRKTYQCLLSYREIGEGVGMCVTTVRKYVAELEERSLIRTERTTVTTKDGRKRNGRLLYHKRGEMEIGETKTERGRRTIRLPPSTVQRLKERKKHAISQWIFPEPLAPEKPVRPSAAYYWMKVLLKEAGLPHIRFHDLRHTFATYALASGVDAKTLSGILGHTNASFTLDTYFELFLLDLSTGLRRGELLALQWSDLDLDAGTLSVTKQVYEVNGKMQLSVPKTKASIRKLVLPPAVVEVFREYRKTAKSRWLFPSPIKEDEPIKPGSMLRRLHIILERAG